MAEWVNEVFPKHKGWTQPNRSVGWNFCWRPWKRCKISMMKTLPHLASFFWCEDPVFIQIHRYTLEKLSGKTSKWRWMEDDVPFQNRWFVASTCQFSADVSKFGVTMSSVRYRQWISVSTVTRPWRSLGGVNGCVELKTPYYALLIRKGFPWSRVIIVIPPNLWGQLSLFPRGNFLGHLEMPSPKPPRPWTMSPSVSLLELVLVQQRVLSPIRHLGSMEGVWGWWYDMIWHAFVDTGTYTVTCYCICHIYILYIYYIWYMSMYI